MPDVIAIVPVDLQISRIGLPALVREDIAGETVLSRTVTRLARIDGVRRIVLVHPEGQDPKPLLKGCHFKKPLAAVPDAAGLTDAFSRRRISARKWALTGWRGGLGGATCFDELLPAAPLSVAMREHEAEAALLVGADWVLVDPDLSERIIQRHLEAPEARQLTFSQAPPGFAGAVVGRKLIDELAQHGGATLGSVLAYQPSRPQGDPIGRDMCVQVEAAVRDTARRFICDTPRGLGLARQLAAYMGDGFEQADAAAIARAVVSLGPESEREVAPLPQQVTLELTPRRGPGVSGPIVPQHHVAIERPEMSLDAALRVVRQLGEACDVALTLGGLGDALCHPKWDQIVLAARDAGVLGIAVETDLLVDEATTSRLLEMPLDVISVRLNADTADTYKRVMLGEPQDQPFTTVVRNLETLLNTVNERQRQGSSEPTPWIVPRLAKTPQTLADMEGFFDRWTHFSGHAVIDAATTGRAAGRDLIESQSPVCMAPPRRRACRQLERRMSIHSSGVVARCDQDWLESERYVDAEQNDLSDIWRDMQPLREAHREGRWEQMPLCAGCHEWHRP